MPKIVEILSAGAVILITLLVIACSGGGSDSSSDASDNQDAAIQDEAVFPLSISSDARRLQDAQGQPFLIKGDSAWSLIVGPDRAGVELYLDDRRRKGFNAIIVNLVEHKFNGPVNAYGNGPFLVSGDFSAPNEAYFAHADWVISKAAEKKIIVFLAPAYLGYGGGDEGWYQEIVTNGPAKMLAYGRYIGNRYRQAKNIIWLVGGDYEPHEALESIRAMVQGIVEQAGPQIFTASNARGETAISQYQGENWLNLNNVYVYTSCSQTAQQLLDAYNWPGPIPYYFQEGHYENETGDTDLCRRSQEYWPVLLGATGYFFGNRPLWLFDPGWQDALNSTGSLDTKRANLLFGSRPWYNLVPDTVHTTLISGYGTLDSDYAAAARTKDGQTVIVYTPSQKQLVIDMTQVSGRESIAWWYNPRTGSVSRIGTFSNSGVLSFTPPSAGDWVLVIDDASVNFSAPG